MAKSLVIFHYKNDLKQLKFHLTFGLAFSDKRNSFRMSVDILVTSCYFMYITEPKRKKVSKFVVFSLSFFFFFLPFYSNCWYRDNIFTFKLTFDKIFFFFLKATWLLRSDSNYIIWWLVWLPLLLLILFFWCTQFVRMMEHDWIMN